MSTPEYLEWTTTQTPENMSRVLDSLDPIINSEIQRYPGPKPLLKTKAKELAIKAVRNYDPASGAKLQSWVVTQMQPLTRYNYKLRPVHTSEVIIRQAAELNRQSRELSDELGRDPTEDEIADKVGLSVRKIRKIRTSTPAVVSEGVYTPEGEDDPRGLPAINTSNRIGTAENVVFESLSDRDKAVFSFKTGKGGTVLSNEEIANRLGVTPALVSQRSKFIAEQIQGLYRKKML